MSTNKQALRKAAEKATPGEWKYSIFDCAITDDTSSLAIVRMDSSHLNDEQSALNGEFIAAANPATMLALLDELEAAEKRTITVKLPADYHNADGSLNADMMNTCAVVGAFREALAAAGITVKGDSE
ncbi:ead/Ea22-like family protein [Lelliottia sp. V106_16]|nr:ead/Ea22-like family protein [Lelliottia sp. V106_16]